MCVINLIFLKLLSTELQISGSLGVRIVFFSYFSTGAYGVGSHLNRLGEDERNIGVFNPGVKLIWSSVLTLFMTRFVCRVELGCYSVYLTHHSNGRKVLFQKTHTFNLI